jgi:hypothetical protein
LKKLLIILSFLFAGTLGARSQTLPQPPPLPSSTVTPSLSGYQHKLKAKQDSAKAAANKYVQPGKTKTTPAKDTVAPAKKLHTGLAEVDSFSRPEPKRFMLSLDHGSCKGVILIPITPDSGNVLVAKPPFQPKPVPEPVHHTPFLTIHGNVLYNLNYYSRIDTPYDEQNIYVHTIQTWLDVVVKGQYPFRIFLTNHFSNSALFRNYSDFNFSYNNSAFNQLVRDQIRRAYLQSLPSEKLIDSLQRVLNSDFMKLKGLSNWEKNPGLDQQMVESREASMKRPAASTDTSANSGLKDQANYMDSLYLKKHEEADSIEKEIGRIEKLLQVTHQSSQGEVSHNLAEIQGLNNPAEVGKKLPGMGVADSSLPKGYKSLMAIKSFNIGRSVVNYSELSAKNISINGVQAEYNPSNYYAFATGTVDYRFRDLIVQQPGEPRQYLNIFRIGKGLKGGNSVILTYFQGRRQLGSSFGNDTTTIQPSAAPLSGFTLEGNYHLTKNILFTGEVGKSNSPVLSNDSTKAVQGPGIFSLNSRNNEAWSMKVSASFPETQTRIRGSYKHLAVDYQSFSIFTDGAAQSAWSVNVDQLLFKKQLEIALGANTNDFSNPFISGEYKSTTVFKCVQATLRLQHWPVISLGYFPSSQITKSGNGGYFENLFYTLVGNSTWSYHFQKLLMNTTVVYTQFYNKNSDSGFTYFDTRNLMLSQTVFLNKFTVQLNASGADNQTYQLYTLEGKVQHSIGKFLTVGAGIKYNKQTVYDIEQYGYSAEFGLRLNRLGQIQFRAEKGFIPGMNKVLVPDNTGRLTYIKSF